MCLPGDHEVFVIIALSALRAGMLGHSGCNDWPGRSSASYATGTGVPTLPCCRTRRELPLVSTLRGVRLGWWDGGYGELRASDADRKEALRLLRVAEREGRLDAVEYDRRLIAVRNAGTRADLVALTNDLPAQRGERCMPVTRTPPLCARSGAAGSTR